MRRLLFVLPLLLLLACSRNDVVKVKGTIKNAEGTFLYLDKLHVNSAESIDSVKIKKNGTFYFKIKNQQPEFYLLRSFNGKLITLLVEPGENIQLDINALKMNGEYTVQGSKGSQLVKELNDQLLKTKDELGAVVQELEEKKDDPDFNITSSALTAKYIEIIQKQREYSANFIIKNATSMAGYMALYQKLDDENYTLNENADIKYFKIVASSMRALYPESEYTIALLNNLKQLQKQIDDLKLKTLIETVGTNYPEIALPDIKGNTRSLNSLKGKFIVLSFWSAKDPSSRKTNQTLKKIYSKYRNRDLEIYQVSVDRNKNLWQNTIRAENLGWINVCDPETGSAKATQNYNIKQVPAVYLISKKGDIVGKNLFGTALEEKIDELMN